MSTSPVNTPPSLTAAKAKKTAMNAIVAVAAFLYGRKYEADHNREAWAEPMAQYYAGWDDAVAFVLAEDLTAFSDNAFVLGLRHGKRIREQEAVDLGCGQWVKPMFRVADKSDGDVRLFCWNDKKWGVERSRFPGGVAVLPDRTFPGPIGRDGRLELAKTLFDQADRP